MLTIIDQFTSSNDPFNSIVWEKRDAVILDYKNKAPDGQPEIIFEQKGVEFPSFWSQQAVNIVTSKYFRGKLGTPERETSLKQVISRVADWITKKGIEQGYFSEERTTDFHQGKEAYIFKAYIFNFELRYILVNQMAAFNSPVWFNVGLVDPPQASACFILDVEDRMESILDLGKLEGMIFKGGSGAGVSFGKVRSSKESLSNGGKSSGPVSFIKGLDTMAGSIKSGGATRRAALMRILPINHLDIEEFIWCKEKEEKKIRALKQAGFEVSLDDNDAFFQNANNSVRVDDAFMKAVLEDSDYTLRGIHETGLTKKVKARDLMKQIAQAAHACADPGIQFDDTINAMHTTPYSGRQESTNPCVIGDTIVYTDKGPRQINDLVGKKNVYVFGYSHKEKKIVRAKASKIWMTKKAAEVIEVSISFGSKNVEHHDSFWVTPDHKFLMKNGSYTQAKDLKPGEAFLSCDDWLGESFVNHIFLVAYKADVYDMTVPDTGNFAIGDGRRGYVLVHNCAEFAYLPKTACNLSSLNLLKFLKDDGTFDIDSFCHTIDIMLLAMEILVDVSSYPDSEITENSRRHRPLGLGYSNLGSLLMHKGLPYDSDKARHYAAAITALMHGRAYYNSAKFAELKGKFEASAEGFDPSNEHLYKTNNESVLNVLHKHEQSLKSLDVKILDELDPNLCHAAISNMTAACNQAKRFGVRNSQVTLLAPAGTISFMMDCSTTGIEPLYGLVTHKALVGGGSMKMVFDAAKNVLKTLNDGHSCYTKKQIEEICSYFEETGGRVEGAPHLKEEHYPIFNTASGWKNKNGENESILPYMAHIKMMAAVQPFLSGGISKTVNFSESATVEDFYNAYIESWKMGLKCIAFYRDNCKAIQPLTSAPTTKKAEIHLLKDEVSEEGGIEDYEIVKWPLPDEIPALRCKFKIGGFKGYMIVGTYPDTNRPGEIFLRGAKAGTTLAGFMDSFVTAVSIGLQYGVPIEKYIDTFRGVSFEPRGFTGRKDIPSCTSVIDFIFRWLENRFVKGKLIKVDAVALQYENHPPIIIDRIPMPWERDEEGDENKVAEEEVKVVGVKEEATDNLCSSCGGIMVRAGACFRCLGCGSSSGCG